MATKTIPAKTVVTCDVCNVERSRGNGRLEAKLTLKRHALDMHGEPAADGTISFDLCDGCHNIIATRINLAAADIREDIARQARRAVTL